MAVSAENPQPVDGRPASVPAGEKPSRFPQEAKWFLLAMVFVITQRVSVRIFDLDGWESNLRRAIFIVTTFGVAFVALRLKRWIGAWVVALGLFMNLLPTVAHGGLMPISIEQLQKSGIHQVTEDDLGKPVPLSKDVLLRREDIHFEWLSDRFILTLPIIDKNIYSAGDFVLAAGLLIAIAEAVIRSGRTERGGSAGVR